MSDVSSFDLLVDRVNGLGSVLLVAGAIFLLVATRFFAASPSTPGTGPTGAASSAASELVETLQNQLQNLREEVKRVSNELAQARANLEQALADNLNLRQENAGLKDKIASLESAPATAAGGLDSPPCWRRANGQPDYLFNAKISSAGILLEKAFSEKSEADYDALPVSQISLDRALSVDEFIRQARPVYDYGVEHGCRHFVRLYEGENDSVAQYKRQRTAVEHNFYIFRP